MPTTEGRLPPALAAWRAQGETAEIFGHRVFYRTEGAGGPVPGATPLLVLHGFPTHSLDFARTLPRLSRAGPVVVHDHLGFGLSDKPADYSYSLVDQADVALALWRRLGIRRGHLVAHDYGTSVATELLARRERGELPVELASVTLSNGSVYLELASLRLSQRLLRHPRVGPLFARLVGRRFFTRRIRALLGRPRAVTDDELAALWAGVARAGGARRMVDVSRYLEERVRLAPRWHPPLSRLDLPCLVLWGRRDPVAVPAIAERLAAEIPGARLVWLEELGHYPMLEFAEAWAREVAAFVVEAEVERELGS